MAETVAPAAGVSQSAASAPRRPGRRGGVRDFRSTRTGYLFVLPALAIFGVFTIFPTIYTFYISLWHWNQYNIALSKFVGAANYKELFQQGDPSFLTAFGHSDRKSVV